MIGAGSHRPLTDARHARGARTLRGAFALFLRFPSPRILALSLGVWLALRFHAGPLDLADAAIALGVAVTWPLLEWTLHVAVLHFRPRTILGRRIDPIAARVHRWHHRHPWIVEGIFLPPQALAVLTPVALLGWWLACGTIGHALTGLATLTAAALLYEWTHFLVHVPYAPRSAYARKIRRNHQLHHFKNERYWHAFTVPAIDTLLGTGPDPDTVERSPTVRSLGIDADDRDPG
jgi:hypothetical protein